MADEVRLADEVRIFENGTLIAAHPVLEGRHRHRFEPGHRIIYAGRRRHDGKGEIGTLVLGAGDKVAQRPLAFYDAIRPGAGAGAPRMTNSLDATPFVIDRIRDDFVGLKMPRAHKALDHVV